jgi:putative peptide zinc metalloprotease protein
VDVSEAWVYASRWQRFVTIIAGVWIEMILCAIATIVWWGTPHGSDAHDIAYKTMLLTGIAVIVVNMNPLIKLDGYYAFSEIIGFTDIKEKSTTYLSGLVRRRVFRLPIEVEYVPKRRRAGYILYAALSGVYSYSLLYGVVRFSHNVFLKYSPDWAFLPALALALIIFRSRIRTLLRFIRTVYLDKKDRIRSWFTTMRTVGAVTALLILLFAPVFHETVTSRFVLEPARRELVRTIVPGRITAVLVREGESVPAGAPLVRMENAQERSRGAKARQNLALTGAQRVQTQLAHGDLSVVQQEHNRARIEQSIAQEETDQLVPTAPIAGTIMTSRLEDLAGSYLDAGSTIAEIGETAQMRVRMFVLEYTVPRVQLGAGVNLLIDGGFSPIHSRVDDVQPAPEDLVRALESIQKVKGDADLKYYIADALIPNDGSLRDGMTGTAKIMVQRRSIAGILSREIREFLDRKIW